MNLKEYLKEKNDRIVNDIKKAATIGLVASVIGTGSLGFGGCTKKSTSNTNEEEQKIEKTDHAGHKYEEEIEYLDSSDLCPKSKHPIQYRERLICPECGEVSIAVDNSIGYDLISDLKNNELDILEHGGASNFSSEDPFLREPGVDVDPMTGWITYYGQKHIYHNGKCIWCGESEREK